jgi:putative spermidine/putrescine transport system permease protein
MPRDSRYLLLLSPLLLFLALTYFAPFLGVMQWSVTMPEPGLGQYKAALADPLVLTVLWRTVRICTLVMLISTAAAYMITLAWVRGGPFLRLIVELCILIPFWISVLTRAFGWLALLSNKGLINEWLHFLGVLSEPLTLAPTLQLQLFPW